MPRGVEEYAPEDVNTCTVDCPEVLGDNVTVGGLSVAEGPLEVTVVARLTLPEKLLRLVRVIVEFPDDP